MHGLFAECQHFEHNALEDHSHFAAFVASAESIVAFEHVAVSAVAVDAVAVVDAVGVVAVVGIVPIGHYCYMAVPLAAAAGYSSGIAAVAPYFASAASDYIDIAVRRPLAMPYCCYCHHTSQDQTDCSFLDGAVVAQSNIHS